MYDVDNNDFFMSKKLSHNRCIHKKLENLPLHE